MNNKPKTEKNEKDITAETVGSESLLSGADGKEIPVKKTENTDVKEPAVQKNAITNDTEVVLKSTVGHLTYAAPKGYPRLRWEKAGDELAVTYADFMEMKAQKPKFLDTPWLMIMTESVLERHGEYRKLYAKFAKVNSLDWLMSNNIETVKRKFKEVTAEMLPQLQTKATALIMDGTVDNIKVIKFLEEKFKTQLISLIP
jgi:hypothetical protein